MDITIGLLGLAGLIPKKRQVEVHQARDTNTHRPASGTKKQLVIFLIASGILFSITIACF